MIIICHVVSNVVTEITMEVGAFVKSFMIRRRLNALYF